jgi:hypothetical protein
MLARLTHRLPWLGVVVTRLTCQENMTLSPSYENLFWSWESVRSHSWHVRSPGAQEEKNE